MGTENTLPVFQMVREKNSAGPWDWEDGEEAVYVCAIEQRAEECQRTSHLANWGSMFKLEGKAMQRPWGGILPKSGENDGG